MEPLNNKKEHTININQNIHRPIPFAVLKIQFKRLVEQHDKSDRGVIYTKNLLNLIDQYEVCEHVLLLTEVQKKAILPYTKSNPDLEMTPDDILNLLKLVCPPSPVASISAPSSSYKQQSSASVSTATSTSTAALEASVIRPRTSPPLKTNKSTPWKRRPSAVASSIQDRNELDLIISSNATLEANNFLNKQDVIDEESQQLIITTSLDDLNHSIDTPELLSPGVVRGEDETKSVITEEEYSNQDLARYYRRSLKLTQRLKSSEKSLASMARDNEDRIVQLQNRVDDMNLEVVKQRREIQEYKGKEKNSLEQIGALESHITNIQRSETDQKQVYLSIKMLFDEKCQETQKLQNMLRQKESDLEKTESLLNSFQYEVQLLSQERKRLIGLQNNLELELETSAQAHKQLAEQKTENEMLKEIIDTLKTDLDEALQQQQESTSAMIFLDAVEEHIENEAEAAKEDESSHAIVPSSTTTLKTLEIELDEDDRLKSVQDEKDYYKSRATEAKEDLDRVKSELDYLRRALDQENRTLVNELAELRLKTSLNHSHHNTATTATTASDSFSTTTASSSACNNNSNTIITTTTAATTNNNNTVPSPTDIIINSIEMNMPEPVNDFWSSSRIRQRSSGSHNNKVGSGNYKKKRTVQDLHEASTSTAFTIVTTNQNRKNMTKKDDKIVTNTVTFALYTVLIYFFGIVTSTFLMEGQNAGQWEQAIVAAASGGQVVPKSKLLEIILYWIEKLLFEPQGLPVS